MNFQWLCKEIQTHYTIYDNCKAEVGFAERALSLVGQRDYEIVKGWFKDTLGTFPATREVAIHGLRLVRISYGVYEKSILESNRRSRNYFG